MQGMIRYTGSVTWSRADLAELGGEETSSNGKCVLQVNDTLWTLFGEHSSVFCCCMMGQSLASLTFHSPCTTPQKFGSIVQHQ